jgi:hypothetical protein
MNETLNRPNASQARFSVSRLAQIKPPGQADASSPSEDYTAENPDEQLPVEPVREDLDDENAPKPQLPIARRPVPVSLPDESGRGETAPRPAKPLAPPIAPRLSGSNLINLSAAPSKTAPGQSRVIPAPVSDRPKPGPIRIPPSEEGRQTAPARIVPAPRPASLPQNSLVSSAASVPTSSSALPPGIQRGFPRPQSGRRSDAQPASTVPPTPPLPTGFPPVRVPVPAEPTLSMLDEPVASPLRGAPAPEVRTRLQAEPFLEQVLDQLSNPPGQTAVIGVCDDGLPVLVDLTDPAPGALLVVSDDDMLRTRLMRTLLQTTAVLNSPRSVQFLIFSAHPEEWRAWSENQEISRHCLGIERLPVDPGDAGVEASADRWLIKLAGWADQRRSGSVTGPAVVLIVDDLRAVTALEYDARVNFDWLVKEGPGERIWPVVGLKSSQAKEMTRWVRLFKTRLLGPAEDPTSLSQLAGDSEFQVESAQFAVKVQERWLKFRLPILPSDAY